MDTGWKLREGGTHRAMRLICGQWNTEPYDDKRDHRHILFNVSNSLLWKYNLLPAVEDSFTLCEDMSLWLV